MVYKFLKSNVLYIGLLATLIGITSYMPIIKHVYYTTDTNDFPYITLYIAILSNILWIIYGYIKGAKASLLQGILYLLIYTYILYVKIIV
jgi:uncharacterized protein with PQ loop repeat